MHSLDDVTHIRSEHAWVASPSFSESDLPHVRATEIGLVDIAHIRFEHAWVVFQPASSTAAPALHASVLMAFS